MTKPWKNWQATDPRRVRPRSAWEGKERNLYVSAGFVASLYTVSVLIFRGRGVHVRLILGCLDSSWHLLAPVLVFCISWSVLGASWGRLGDVWGHVLAPHGASTSLLDPSLERLGACWERRGARAGGFLSVLGPSWSVLGESWGVLGPSLARLGASLGHLEVSRGDLWIRLGAS